MSASDWFRLVCGAVMGVVILLDVHWQEATDRNPAKKNRYVPVISPILLLTACTFFFAVSFLPTDRLSPAAALFQGALAILQAGLYDIVLLALTPLLRRVLSGKARATLWVLPNTLYGLFYGHTTSLMPRWIIPLEGRWPYIALAVWGAGAAAALGWKIAGHLRYRHILLRGAREAPVPTRNVLRREERALQLKESYTLLIAPAATTPLSIGLFRVRIVLPERDYDEDDLALIFRHELIHLRRMDAWTKFFLTVCAALAWFNPLVWLAMRRSAEDFEMGCDEMTLSGADGPTRRRYAALLLSAAGDGRGFTTCLSPAASSLRARLKNAVAPERRFSGALTAGLLVLLLFLTSGQVAVAWDGQRAAERVFENRPAEDFTFSEIFYYRDRGSGAMETYAPGDREAVTDYLAGLRLYQISGDYILPTGPQMIIYYNTPGETLFQVSLRDHTLAVISGGDIRERVYYHEEAIDWAYLTGLFGGRRQRTGVFQPLLTLRFDHEALEGERLFCTPAAVSKTVNGVDVTPPRDSGGHSASVIEGFDVSEVTMFLSDPPDACSVTVEDRARGNAYTVEFPDRADWEAAGVRLALAPDSARYTVTAAFAFEDDGISTRYVVEYVFEVELPETNIA